MFLRPSASFTYSTKSALPGSRGSWVLRSSTRRAELAGTKWTCRPRAPRAVSPSRSWSVMEEGASRAPSRRPRAGRARGSWPCRRRGPTVARRARACSSSMCTPVRSSTVRASSTIRRQGRLEHLQVRPHVRSAIVARAARRARRSIRAGRDGVCSGANKEDCLLRMTSNHWLLKAALAILTAGALSATSGRADEAPLRAFVHARILDGTGAPARRCHPRRSRGPHRRGGPDEDRDLARGFRAGRPSRPVRDPGPRECPRPRGRDPRPRGGAGAVQPRERARPAPPLRPVRRHHGAEPGRRQRGGFQVRSEQNARASTALVSTPPAGRRREDPGRGASQVAAVAALEPDWVKIRVDDNLGTTPKMPPEVYRAVIDEAHRRRLRVAAHLFYLADAGDLSASGVDFIAHSVRDREVDAAFVPCSPRGSLRQPDSRPRAPPSFTAPSPSSFPIRSSSAKRTRAVWPSCATRGARRSARARPTARYPEALRRGQPQPQDAGSMPACPSPSAPTRAHPPASRAISNTWSCGSW